MAADTVITVIGNLTAAPELRYTPAGVAVVNFTVASTPRYLDRTTNEWTDGDPLFMPCSIWREAAENIAESSLPRGARVIVTGRLKQRSYQTREGDKRTVVELDADEVAASMRFATATVTKANRRTNSRTDTTISSRANSDDPWASAGSREPAFAGTGEEPSF
ncbi:single-stranded DNA-binding protein [Nocardia pseudovaccinii]|uniref:single-stranded DNA-binding protein n=1 Tax=Nocardia pseudovaccinii TaxID=189540 RepID=UPI0007A4A78E|nr:single-stranded DNA-binding protein [Nocardia pseudovaccinii]